MASASHGQGAATAPAREKSTAVTASGSEIERPSKKDIVVFESGAQVRPPAVFGASTPASTFSTRRSEDAGKESGGSSRMLVAVAILVIAVAGYFGWTATHGKAGKSAAGVKQAPISATVPQPSAAQDSATPQIKDQTGSVPPEVQAGHKGGTTATKSATSSSKPSAAIASGNKSDVKAASTENDVTVTSIEPMVVTNDVKRHSPAVSQAQPDVPVPNALNIASGSGADKAISNIMTSTPVSVPKPAPQSIKVSQGVSQGLLIKKVQPSYPSQALAMRMQGAVQLQATINKDGSVSNLKVLSGEAILSRAALDAVRQWKYKPYFLNGEPVEIQTQIVVNFKLPN
jgi:TonB family protein